MGAGGAPAALVVATIVAGGLLASCAGESGSSGRPQVVAALYPLAFVADRVAGTRADVVDLTPPGAEPHDLELTPGQVGDVIDADLVLYVGNGFQPSVEEAVTGTEGMSVAAARLGSAGGEDPHAWLDPEAMGEIAATVAERMGELDPGGAADYLRAAEELGAELEDLDSDYRQGLADCRLRSFVVTHEAFGRLADRYGLRQIGIAGIDPEAEPTPSQIAEVVEVIRSEGVTTVFFEPLVSPRAAETVAAETDVVTAELDPLEGKPAMGDYFTRMRANLHALRSALECE